MKLFWNWFSGKTYIETETSIIDEEGHVAMKTPSGFFTENGEFIAKQGDGLINMETGVWSKMGDPFTNDGY